MSLAPLAPPAGPAGRTRPRGHAVTPWQVAVFERLNHDRDLSILLSLAEAGVLATGELAVLHFTNAHLCRRRLRALRELRLVTGWRPGRARDAETCWALTARGAKVLSELLGEPVSAGAWGEASTRAMPHRRAVAAFFTALVATPASSHLVAARATGRHAIRAAAAGETSTLWLGERSCRLVFGDASQRPHGLRVALVPDGAAMGASGEARVAIVPELDRGTESAKVLTEKLARYARVGGMVVVVCFTSPTRAARWRPPDLGVRVLAGDLASHLASPWGPVWHDPAYGRVALGELAEATAPVRGRGRHRVQVDGQELLW
jgi:hypothetical protein